jgi:hypothetical protein
MEEIPWIMQKHIGDELPGSIIFGPHIVEGENIFDGNEFLTHGDLRQPEQGINDHKILDHRRKYLESTRTYFGRVHGVKIKDSVSSKQKAVSRKPYLLTAFCPLLTTQYVRSLS